MRGDVMLAVLLLTVAAGPASAGDVVVQKAAATECAAVALLKLPDVRVTGAEAVAPGASSKPAKVTVPHCRVEGVIGTEIRFRLVLPDGWNGRFVMGGGGGFVGTVDNQVEEVANRGFATVGTDTGHQASGIQAGWALDNLERQVNYGYLGVHRTAEVAKAIVRAYYGRDAAYAYFLGCSNGGRQALMEAQRFPGDFDGIVAGAPAYDFTRIAASFITHAQATFPDPADLKTSAVSPAELRLAAAGALEACDGSDGVKDGVIDQPQTCRFTVSTVKPCPDDVPAEDCVTRKGRTALARIYAPISGPDGEIYPGQPVGGEADPGGWRDWITGVEPKLASGTGGKVPSLRHAFGTEFFKYFVHGDPAWDYRRFDVSTWARDTRVAATFLNADSVDLDAFKARRGKLLLWHGWADPALNAVSTVRYYDRLLARDPHAADYARLFLMPGVLHCAGGAGPDVVDWLTAMSQWTEQGAAPERLIAAKVGAGGAPLRTRPLCRHPQRAVYAGTGSTDDATSFACR